LADFLPFYNSIKKNNMKTIFYLSALLLVFTLTTHASVPGSRPPKEKVESMTEEQKKARLEEIKLRVYEIKNMDRSHLTRQEKRDLKKELKTMKTEAQAARGVYLSIGAIIIIILLLILIL
jgi:hypothetical protein